MPLDPNALFTFGIPAAVIGSLVWRRTRPAKPVEQRPAVALPEVKEGDTLPARAWLDYVNSQPQTVPHLAVIGPSGSGKTTLTTAVLSDRPGQITVITAKEGDHWGGLPYVGIDDNATYTTARQTFSALDTEVKRRLVAAKHNRLTADWMTIVVDDFSTLVKEAPIAADVVKLVARLGRSLQVRLIMLSDSALVKAIGLEGEGETRSNFAFLRLQRGHKGALEIDGAQLPIDTRLVAPIAGRAQLSSRAWRMPRDPEAELTDLIGVCVDDPGVFSGDIEANTRKHTQTHASTRIAMYRVWRANNITRDQARAIRQADGDGLDDREWAEAGKELA
jgi:energy-coupling factor transporter ATP-binding protein EcfA2